MGLRQHLQTGLEAETRLLHGARIEDHLWHRSDLDHQTAGPALHQEALLGVIRFMQIHRQTQSLLNSRSKGQVGGPAVVHHQ